MFLGVKTNKLHRQEMEAFELETVLILFFAKTHKNTYKTQLFIHLVIPGTFLRFKFKYSCIKNYY